MHAPLTIIYTVGIPALTNYFPLLAVLRIDHHDFYGIQFFYKLVTLTVKPKRISITIQNQKQKFEVQNFVSKQEKAHLVTWPLTNYNAPPEKMPCTNSKSFGIKRFLS